MLIDGITLLDSAVASNFSIASGDTLPTTGNNLGELFYKTSINEGLYAYNGALWKLVSVDPTLIGHVADDTLHLTSTQNTFLDGVTITFGEVNSLSGITSNVQAQIDSKLNKAGATMTGDLVLSADPVSALSAATKQYVDTVAAGLHAHAAAVSATTVALPASTYNNGTAGVGSSLTANANGALGTIGGYAGLVAGDRVLVKNQGSALQNGVYTITDLGSAGTPWILTRAADFDNAPSSEIAAGDFVYVQEGTLSGSQWVQTTVDLITIGTSPIVFSQLSGAGSSTTNVVGGVAGAVLYQSAPGVTASTSAGSVGQILQSNGAASPTWVPAPTPALGTGQIGFGVAGILAGSPDLAFDSTSTILSVGKSGAQTSPIIQASQGASSSANTLTVRAGASANSSGGDLYLAGGGGVNYSAGGNVHIAAGNSWNASTGSVIFESSSGVVPVVTERARMLSNGAWSFGATGSAVGTVGQVLTSNGNAAPTWATIATGFNGGTVANATTFTSVSPQITLGTSALDAGITAAASSSTTGNAFNILGSNAGGTGTGGTLNIAAGLGNGGGNGGTITIAGGAGGIGRGGPAYLQGGKGGTGGVAYLQGGIGTVSYGGAVNIAGGANIAAGSGGAGGAVNIVGGTTIDGPGSDITIAASPGVNTSGLYARSGGALTLAAGNGVTGSSTLVGNGGDISLTAGNGAGTGSAGNLVLKAGIANGTGLSGNIIFSSGPTAGAITERFRILNNGAWSVGTTGTATGTAAQVLTSTGATTPPTWQPAPGFSGGTVANATTFTSASPQITLGVQGAAPVNGVITSANATGGSQNAPSLTLAGGSASAGISGAVNILGGSSPTATVAAAVNITGGQNDWTGGGGAVNISGGSALGGGVGGSTIISGGLGFGAGGAIVLSTGATTVLSERLRILANGAWSVGTGGAAYGSVGQVLTSNGNAAPTWQTAGALNGLVISTTASTSSINVTDTGLYGAGIKLTGNGGTTPVKYIRSQGGKLEFVNSGYSAAVMSMTDAGALTATSFTGAGSGLTGTAAALSIGGNANTATTITGTYAGTLTSTQITNGLAYTPLNKTGDTMSGLLILSADPVQALGAVTKQYVDNLAAGLNAHASVVTSSTAALPSVTYANGTAGVGATLTATANGALASLGGYVGIVAGDRVLIKDQAAPAQNGIYTITNLGSAGTPFILTRASDFDGSPAQEITAGDFTYVQEGTIGGTQWVMTTIDLITVGTSPISFTQLSGSGTYTGGLGVSVLSNVISNTGVLSAVAGTGISVSGSTGYVTITNAGVTSIAGSTSQIVASASAGAVTLSLPPSVTVSGTISAGTFAGSGASLTSIPTTALTTSALTIGATSIALGDTVTSLTGLTSVTSTSFVGALTGNAGSATVLQTARNINGVPFNGSADVTVSAAAGTLTGSSLAVGITGSSLTSVGTLGSLAVTAGITAGTVSAGTFTGALTGNATTATSATSASTATNVAAGAAGSVPYQSAAGVTAMLAAGTASQVLVSGASPSWTNAPTLSGTNFTGIPNAGLTNSTITIGSTSIVLGGSNTTIAGLASVSSAGFTVPVSAAGAVTINDRVTASQAFISYVSSNTYRVFSQAAAADRLTLDATGNLTASGNVAAYSDERRKTNWQPVQADFVQKLAGVKAGIYDRTDEKLTQVGVSAQSLQAVLPEAVLTDADGYLSVAYGQAAMVAVIELAKLVQELQAEIKALKGA